MFGVDAPKLIQMIKEELAKEIQVIEKECERKSVSGDVRGTYKVLQTLTRKQFIFFFLQNTDPT